MPRGPKNPNEARTWARFAISNGLYIKARHFDQRCLERKVTLLDVICAIGRCSIVEPFSDMPKNNGTCWRAFGPTVDGDATIGVGFEAFVNEDGNRIILCTVLPPKRKR